MFCPKCKGEYIENITRCPKCEIELVTELKDEEDYYEYQDLVSVFGPADASAMAIAKSLLEDEGIKYFIKGELLQDLFGVGRINTGYNPIFGPELVQVAPEDAERAKELLQDIDIDFSE